MRAEPEQQRRAGWIILALAATLLAMAPRPGTPTLKSSGAPWAAARATAIPGTGALGSEARAGGMPHAPAQEEVQEEARQEVPVELPPAREVIDRYVEAIGGAELIRSFESRYAAGSFELEGQGLAGTVEIRSAAPNLLVVELQYEGVGAARTGFNGEVGWSIDPITGPRVLRGQELDQLRDDADFYGDLHDPSKYAAIETLGREQFGGHDTWKIRLERASGRVYFEYFDVETGLMVGNEGEQASMMGPLNVVSVIDDYREFDGLLVATRVTQDFGMGQKAVTVLDRIEHGTLSQEDFTLPAQIQALVQQ